MIPREPSSITTKRIVDAEERLGMAEMTRMKMMEIVHQSDRTSLYQEPKDLTHKDE